MVGNPNIMVLAITKRTIGKRSQKNLEYFDQFRIFGRQHGDDDEIKQ